MKLTHSTSAVTGSHIPTIHVTAQSMAGQYHAVRSQENEDSIIKIRKRQHHGSGRQRRLL